MDLNLNSKTESKSTWKNTSDLTKRNVVFVYDALSKVSTSKKREDELRRIIHFPTEYESVFANLIHKVNDIFTSHECPSTSYKNVCYKKLKTILNEFQESLSDYGTPVRFTFEPALTQTSKTSTHTPTPTPKHAPSPIPFDGPAPLLPSPQNLIYNMPQWKLRSFVEMFITTEDQIKFIQNYVVVLDEQGEPFPGMVHDITEDMMSYENDVNNILKHLEHLITIENHKPHEEKLKIHILYPFRVIYPSNRRNPNIRNLGGGKKRQQTKRNTKRKYNLSLTKRQTSNTK